jgi:hypothetical protein
LAKVPEQEPPRRIRQPQEGQAEKYGTTSVSDLALCSQFT